MEEKKERGFPKVLQGIVKSNKMAKTITVLVTRTVQHPFYSKFIKRHKQYHAHDENNMCEIGDRIEIVETSPVSKTKKWRFGKMLEKVKK